MQNAAHGEACFEKGRLAEPTHPKDDPRRLLKRSWYLRRTITAAWSRKTVKQVRILLKRSAAGTLRGFEEPYGKEAEQGGTNEGGMV